ncbi:NHL repeat-containing protein 2 [Trichonephila inaurata madagascariensis]|uniref:NHL repeat-containing protein 2 n=1 Tax=Trichonephila inaurata madagascariensis TaxID=2747483 RepID=A0A8X6XSD3_9ARAC|nr:NHL repeat-containing protein 2 [Trichonephila inaurata madagascariensis]
MDDCLNEPCLFNLYDYDNCEITALLETNSKDVYRESDRWRNVIHSHIERILQSPKSLKLKNLGGDLDWLNSSKPLSLDDELMNKILVLDFFTYCCINCEHVFPFLQQVEEEFEKNPELVVIGVHSPKFPNEKALDNVKNAVLRNNIKHPVINDPENYLWKTLGIYCWPTVLITSPAHHVLFSLVGEAQIEKLNYFCQQTLNYFKINNISLNISPLSFMHSEEYRRMNSLLYPSGISTCSSSIIVSDTGHNRLLLLSFDGKVLDIIGSGVIGHKDGSFKDSSFNHPHGSVWWRSNFVFVADTGNNSIRMIDIKAKKVYTVFDGKKSIDNSEGNSEKLFASPWDVCLGQELGSDKNELNVLYIAVAGSHQIWAAHLNDLQDNEQQLALKCFSFAGNGTEECRNNTYKGKAGFAQPSGVSCSELHPRTLYIADSESSSIRSISLNNGCVKTVAGGGLDPKDLFQYGDKDGSRYDVKLQHPLGICVTEDEKIFITDSYNHKIKLINAKKQEYKELLLIADTNNHSIKMIDQKTQALKCIQVIFPNLSCTDASIPSRNEKLPSQDDPNYRKINLAYGGKIKCSFKLAQPGISLTEGIVQPWNVAFKGSCDWTVACQSNTLFDSTNQPSLILTCIDTNTKVHKSEIVISANLSVCDDANKICLLKKVVAKLEVEISDVGSEVYDGVFIFN